MIANAGIVGWLTLMLYLKMDKYCILDVYTRIFGFAARSTID